MPVIEKGIFVIHSFKCILSNFKSFFSLFSSALHTRHASLESQQRGKLALAVNITSHDSPVYLYLKMAAKQVAESAGKTVLKPLLSTSHVEARRRVMNLYRAWWREVHLWYSFRIFSNWESSSLLYF